MPQILELTIYSLLNPAPSLAQAIDQHDMHIETMERMKNPLLRIFVVAAIVTLQSYETTILVVLSSYNSGKQSLTSWNKLTLNNTTNCKFDFNGIIPFSKCIQMHVYINVTLKFKIEEKMLLPSQLQDAFELSNLFTSLPHHFHQLIYHIIGDKQLQAQSGIVIRTKEKTHSMVDVIKDKKI